MRYSRKGRYLPPNDSTRQPARHIFVDVESVSRKDADDSKTRIQTLRLWCASAILRVKGKTIRREQSSGTSPESFWHWVYGQCKESKPIWIWSHNASVDTTWLCLADQLDCGALSYRSGVWETVPFVLYLRYIRTNIRIVSSTNWFNFKLSELGSIVGLEKFPYPGEEADDELLSAYCRRDVEILERAVVGLLDFVRENDLGMFRPTLPQQSLAYFRHLRIEPKITLPEDLGVKELERKCFYGGRCECGFVGNVVSLQGDKQAYLESDARPAPTIYGEHVYYLDIQSHYPAVMQYNEYPHRFVFNRESYRIDQVRDLLNLYLMCAKVLVHSETTPYPYRTKLGTVYATGHFWTYLCTPELRMAIERDEVEKIGEVQAYEGSMMFARPMHALWNLRKKYRQDGNMIYDHICKLLMNSMYGKFGQRAGGWRDAPKRTARQRWGQYFEVNAESGCIQVCRAIAGNVQVKFPRGETLQSFPAIAAHVTSYGRVKLQKLLEVCPPKSVYYWDTDSIHCNHFAYECLKAAGHVKPGVMGCLRLVRTVDHAEYINAKCYVHDGKYTVAGMPGGSQPIDKWTLKGEVWQRIGRILQERPQGEIRTREAIIELSGKYERRQVSRSGFTSPLWIDERSERNDTRPLDF